jgi:hypothetical protein
VVHTYNPNTPEAEAGGSGILRQSGLYSKTLSQKTKQNKKEKKNCHIFFFLNRVLLCSPGWPQTHELPYSAF